MSTRADLKSRFGNGQFANAAAFADLIDSLKVVQSAVSDPAAAGTSVTFIATISQDTDGKITVTKKTVNFNGYQTVAGMSGYQNLDLQQVGDITVDAGNTQDINHGMKHYPTVRLIDVATGIEVKVTAYQVKHADEDNVSIVLGDMLKGSYKYILD